MMLDKSKAMTIVLVKGVCLLTDFVLKNQINHPRHVSSSARFKNSKIRSRVRVTPSAVNKSMKFRH
jgi:hypothetical protein